MLASSTNTSWAGAVRPCHSDLVNPRSWLDNHLLSVADMLPLRSPAPALQKINPLSSRRKTAGHLHTMHVAPGEKVISTVKRLVREILSAASPWAHRFPGSQVTTSDPNANKRLLPWRLATSLSQESQWADAGSTRRQDDLEIPPMLICLGQRHDDHERVWSSVDCVAPRPQNTGSHCTKPPTAREEKDRIGRRRTGCQDSGNAVYSSPPLANDRQRQLPTSRTTYRARRSSFRLGKRAPRGLRNNLSCGTVHPEKSSPSSGFS